MGNEKNERNKEILKGQYWGEKQLMLNTMNPGNYVAKRRVNLVKIERDAFFDNLLIIKTILNSAEGEEEKFQTNRSFR